MIPKKFLTLLFAAFVAFSLAGCDLKGDDDEKSDSDSGSGSGSFTMSATAASNDVYFDLDSGAAVDSGNSATQTWDLKLSLGSFRVYTNSGDTATAEGSGGVGGVVEYNASTYTNTASLDYSIAFAADTSVWVAGMSTTQNILNVMTFIGYDSGDGLSESTAYSGSNYSSGYYTFSHSTYTYSPTDRQYVVKNGAGTAYYLIKVTAMDYEDGVHRTIQVSYSKL